MYFCVKAISELIPCIRPYKCLVKGEFVKYCNTCNHKTYKMKMKSTVDLLWYETFIKLFSFEDKQYPSPFFTTDIDTDRRKWAFMYQRCIKNRQVYFLSKTAG